MEGKFPGNLSEILKFEQRVHQKNRQLHSLKQLSVMLSQVVNEEFFIKEAVPVIRQSLDDEKNLVIYVEMDGETTIISDFPPVLMKEINVYLQSALGSRQGPIVVDLLNPDPGDPFGFYREKGFAKCVFSPIFHDTNRMGFLAIPKDASFSMNEDEKIFLNYLCEIIGVFFEYIQLNRNLKQTKTEIMQQYQDLNAVYSVSRSLVSQLDTKSILNNALDTILAQKVLNVLAKGGIFLYNEETGRLDMTCHRNIGGFLEENEKSIELGYCLCGRAAQTGEIVTSTDCFLDKRHDTQYGGMIPHGHLIIPLKAKDLVLGVLFLYLPPGVEATTSQIELLSAIASQLSVALENAHLYEKVRHLSVHDPLTNLSNRRLLLERLDVELSRSRRFEEPLSLAMIDIDHFKLINDRYGHLVGDGTLKELAAVLKSAVRAIDVVARYGGDEFTILLPGSPPDQTAVVMERIRQAVEAHDFSHYKNEEEHQRVTVSIGLAGFFAELPMDSSELIRAADESLYKAKNAGRNKVAVHTA